jgi:ribosome biogenesis GTPase
MNWEGFVLKSTGSWYDVKTDSGALFRCRLRGKLKLKGVNTTNPVAVGDNVRFSIEKDQEGIIHEILPRTNYLIRKSTRKTSYGHIIASNIDQAILVASLIFPRTSIGFIDRYLVSADSFRIPAKIIFNKSDLLNKPLMELHDYLASIYSNIGYENILISAKEDEDINRVTEWLYGKKTLLSGHSGVGKSTILNRINPDLQLPTDEVSNFANKGKHTTTFAEMIEIKKDSYVIDTPGIKELGLIDMESWEISHYFPEMRERLGECKYKNCLHINEPGCVIIQAVEEQKIADTRYDSYVSMIIDDDNRR